MNNYKKKDNKMKNYNNNQMIVYNKIKIMNNNYKN